MRYNPTPEQFMADQFSIEIAKQRLLRLPGVKEMLDGAMPNHAADIDKLLDVIAEYRCLLADSVRRNRNQDRAITLYQSALEEATEGIQKFLAE